MLTLTAEEARRFLVAYHLTPTDVAGVLGRLGSVQYDPLNPLGRNPDLVLQARVPGYRVDGWQRAAYADRLAYDAWDKQACLVPTSDWAHRALIRLRYHPWHDRQILDEHPDVLQTVFSEIDSRGPLSSLEFEGRRRAPERHSWYGPTIVKRVLRALWARGELVTHHREAGRHYYDRPERVIPGAYLDQPPQLDEGEYRRWIVLRRHTAAGLLRPGASPEIWSVCGTAAERREAVFGLVERGDLIPVKVGLKGSLYHLPRSALPFLDASPPAAALTFLGPLDNLLWDRAAVREIFGFEYIWEVYKKPQDRRWGYYVLPVLHGDRFVARIDSRLEGTTWNVSRWWWEEDVRQSDVLEALRATVPSFLRYLGAEDVEARGVEPDVRAALEP